MHEDPRDVAAEKEAEARDEILANPVLLAAAFEAVEDRKFFAETFALVVQGKYSLQQLCYDIAEEYAPELVEERAESGAQTWGEIQYETRMGV